MWYTPKAFEKRNDCQREESSRDPRYSIRETIRQTIKDKLGFLRYRTIENMVVVTKALDTEGMGYIRATAQVEEWKREAA